MLSLSRVTKCLVTVLDGRVKGEFIYQVNNAIKSKRYKGKGFPYSLSSVGPGTDPGAQAVSPQSSTRR